MPDSGFFLDYQSPKAGPADGARDIARQSPREVPREILREAAPERETASRQLDTARTQVQVGTTIAGKYHSGLRWAFEMFNATSGVNQDCITAHASGGAWPDDPTYLCFFAEHTVPYTHTPIFALQSEYDSWQQMYVVAKGESVQTLGDNITRLMYANSLGPHRQNGAFLDSCSHHCGSWNAITIDGEQLLHAVSDAGRGGGGSGVGGGSGNAAAMAMHAKSAATDGFYREARPQNRLFSVSAT
eukprot:6181809-Pleurochrysis_carterae.AAC.5